MESATALDDRTWEDLTLDEVFAAIDRTHSTLGQHALYHRLRVTPAAGDREAFESLVSRFGIDVPARETAQVALAGLQDPQGYDLWWLARPDAVTTASWYIVFPALTLATILVIALAVVWHQLIPVAMLMAGGNVAVRWLADRHIGAITMALRQLPSVIAAGHALEFLEPGEPRLDRRALQSDARGLQRLKTITRWITGDPFLLPAHSSSLTLLLNDIVNTAFEYLNGALLLDATGACACAGELRRHGAALVEMVATAGDVDVALSVASFRAGRADWTIPEFRRTGAAIVMTDMKHPLVTDAVPNTIAFEAGTGGLITGSNMSGKSTFLRTVGVTAVMAQTLNTCLARTYSAPVLRLRSCIGRADDLVAGKSYYIVEVEALLGLVDSSRSETAHLYLLDELFRGTNAIERIAAGEAVLRELLRSDRHAPLHVVLAATHDSELVDLLAPLYAAHHFGDAVGDNGLIFDHRLQPGRATTRNAIALLRLHGAPETLVTAALSRAAALDRERGNALLGR